MFCDKCLPDVLKTERSKERKTTTECGRTNELDYFVSGTKFYQVPLRVYRSLPTSRGLISNTCWLRSQVVYVGCSLTQVGCLCSQSFLLLGRVNRTQLMSDIGWIPVFLVTSTWIKGLGVVDTLILTTIKFGDSQNPLNNVSLFIDYVNHL